MKRIITSFVIIIVFCIHVKAQNNISSISGNWILTKYELVDIENPQSSTLTKDNCPWSAYIDGVNQLQIDEDGSFMHYNDNYPIKAKIEINCAVLKITYSDMGGKTSYTEYEYTISKNKFTILRSDPKFKESYTFTRK
jgi:hypothetical protein